MAASPSCICNVYHCLLVCDPRARLSNNTEGGVGTDTSCADGYTFQCNMNNTNIPRTHVHAGIPIAFLGLLRDDFGFLLCCTAGDLQNIYISLERNSRTASSSSVLMPLGIYS